MKMKLVIFAIHILIGIESGELETYFLLLLVKNEVKGTGSQISLFPNFFGYFSLLPNFFNHFSLLPNFFNRFSLLPNFSPSSQISALISWDTTL